MPDKKPKKIIFLTNLNVLGGTENNLVSIVSHPLFMQCFSPFIFSGTKPHPVIISRLSSTNTKVIQHNSIGGLRSPRILRDTIFKRQLQKINPEIVVFWNHVAKSRQLHICKKLKIKTVFFERGTSWREHSFLGMQDFLSSVDLVLSNSDAGKQILAIRWGYKDECLVLPNAVRPEITLESPGKIETVGNRPLRIGVAARLVAYKGVASVVLAMKELQDKGVHAELHIAGNGPETETLKALSSDLDIKGRFYGIVDDMAGFYRKIDILVVPSIRESFGTVAIEAQALGRPVICSAVDGLSRVLLPGKTGCLIEPTVEIRNYLKFVADKKNMPNLVYYPLSDTMGRPRALDPREIASAIEGISSEPGKLEGMSKNSVALVKDEFSFDKHIREIVRVIDQS